MNQSNGGDSDKYSVGNQNYAQAELAAGLTNCQQEIYIQNMSLK